MLRYCSACNVVMPANQYAKHRRLHHERRGSTTAWRKLRQLVLARDHHRCVVCGATDRLEIHHLDGDWRNNDPGNLEVRCLAHNPRGAPPYGDMPQAA